MCAAQRCVAQISWINERPAGISDDIWGVTYANHTFAAVTNQGRLLNSADGVTWSSQTIDAGVWLLSIAYGNGEWVAVGDKGTILVSPDLKTWVNAKAVTTEKLNGVLYAGSVWVSVGEQGTIATSPDGQTWTLQPAIPGAAGFLHGIAYVPASTAADSPQFPASIWISGQSGVLIQGLAPSSAPNSFAFSLYYMGPTLLSELTTQDLEALLDVSSTSLANLETLNLLGVGSGGTIIQGGFNVGGDSQESLGVSTVTPAVIYRGLAFGNGFFVAAGEQGTILTSTNGKDWIQRFSGDSPSTLTTATLLNAAYSSTLQRFVVVGTAGTILVSNSPPTVFGNVSTRDYVSPTETFIGGFVVQGTAPRTILIRGDGPVLSTFSVPSPLPDPVVTVFDNTGAVVATNTGWSTNLNPASLSTAALEVGAFALPASSADSALLLTLAPGAYTVQITSAKGNSGIALFEAYTD
jgi:hypothetical protein